MPAAQPHDVASHDLTALGAVELARLVAEREVSATDVLTAHLERVIELNPRLNALTLLDADRSLTAAAELDTELRRRSTRAGPLAGVPVVVKDNIEVRGHITSCGSRAHDGVAATRDAPAVHRLVRRGAILLGRANMDELAMGASTQTSAFGPTRNPVDVRRSPGGSSGGCAAAVAARMAPLAVGTDTGGSIREPASQCGVVGMAPTPGLVPIDGVVPFARGLDRVGPLGRDVADTRVAMTAMADRVRGRPVTAQRAEGSPPRVAVVGELVTGRNRAEVREPFEAWLAALRRQGVEVGEATVPDAPRALGAYMKLTSVSALEWLEPWVTRGGAGEELTRRYHYGLELRDDDRVSLEHADDIRRRLTAQVRAALEECPILVSPTMPTTAPLLDGEITPEDLADPLAAPYTDCWTVVANLAGVPALSVPAPTTGLPAGAMLMGRPGADAALLQLAEHWA